MENLAGMVSKNLVDLWAEQNERQVGHQPAEEQLVVSPPPRPRLSFVEACLGRGAALLVGPRFGLHMEAVC